MTTFRCWTSVIKIHYIFTLAAQSFKRCLQHRQAVTNFKSPTSRCHRWPDTHIQSYPGWLRRWWKSWEIECDFVTNGLNVSPTLSHQHHCSLAQDLYTSEFWYAYSIMRHTEILWLGPVRDRPVRDGYWFLLIRIFLAQTGFKKFRTKKSWTKYGPIISYEHQFES